MKSFSYDVVGNIISKSECRHLCLSAFALRASADKSANPPGGPLPHAVMSISGSTVSTTYTYDLNGNQTAGLGRTVTWTSYNKPATITQGARSASFLHDMDHQRFKQVATDGTTLYLNAFGVMAELIAPGTSAARWNDYLAVGNVKVGVRFTEVATTTVTTRYFHTDHLGSIAVITNEAGAVIERLAYDAWGKRRFPDGTDDPAGTIESETTRGFTGHEQLDVVGLVHMNGRVYDPMIGRMISPDPIVPDALNAQAWNRYSYVGNDPLTFTDPTGHSWLSSFFRAVARVFQQVPILRAIVQVALAIIAAPIAAIVVGAGIAASVVAAAASSAIVTGLSGGNLGQMLRAGAIAGATAFAFNVVGDITGHTPAFATPAHAANIAGHAGVGCLTSVASGGSCESGALSGAVGAAGAPLINTAFPHPDTNPGDYFGGAAASGVLGGLASVAGGGKFENGAVTAAFGYMYNNCYSCLQEKLARQDLPLEDAVSPFDFIGGGVRPLANLLLRRAAGALEGPASGTVQAWGGTITSGAVPEGGMTAYRIWGGGSGQVGEWLSPIAPESSSLARRLLSLPPRNTAEFISPVRIPGGTQIQFGNAAGAFGQPGGGIQIQLLERIPTSGFGPATRLRP